MKQYWKEILIAVLIALLIWTNSNTKTRTIGSTDTICHVDTIYLAKPAPTLIRYERILLPRYDTVEIVLIDTLEKLIIDTSWLYADVPVQDYTQRYALKPGLVQYSGMDSIFWEEFKAAGKSNVEKYGLGINDHLADISIKVRTIGWLDTMSVEVIQPPQAAPIIPKIYPSVWADLSTIWPSEPGEHVPDIGVGIMLQYKQWTAGYNRSTRGTHLISIGHKLW